MSTSTADELGVEFDVYLSTVDNTVVVHINTPGLTENSDGPHLRVYINDDTDNPVWDNPAETVEEKLNG
jgi:hypothetical protein